MKKIYFLLIIFTVIYTMSSCLNRKHDALYQLKEDIEKHLYNSEGEFAVAFKNLEDSTQQILINERKMFHAASTMKTPVMVELFKQSAEGYFKLSDSIMVKNEFRSIMDSSIFSMDLNSDSGEKLYSLLGRKTSIYHLIHEMITKSSNLATNILIELVRAENVTNSLREMGARDILVLRGVEDLKAYEAGQSNRTNAYDLMLLYEKLARKELVNKNSSTEMIKILKDQYHNDIIPAALPKTAKVAHKTGQITSIMHDSGIVYLKDGQKYVLVLLSGGWKNERRTNAVMIRISEMIYTFMVQQKVNISRN